MKEKERKGRKGRRMYLHLVKRVGTLVLADPKVDNNRVAAPEGGDG